MPDGFRREPSFSALSIPASAGRAHPLLSRPTADGTSVPTTACLSWSSAVPERRAAGTSTGSRSASRSFHGRDLFAPVAAMLARGEPPPGRPRTDDADRRAHWPDDLCEIVYVDHFGNAMTGVRAAMLPPNARLAAAGHLLERERTFAIGRLARSSGTRIQTGSPKLPLIRDARTAMLVSRSAFRSRSA